MADDDPVNPVAAGGGDGGGGAGLVPEVPGADRDNGEAIASEATAAAVAAVVPIDDDLHHEHEQERRPVTVTGFAVACHEDHLKAAVRAVFDRSNWTPAAISARPLPKKKREYIKRPMNAFMVWAQTARPMIAGREPKMQNAEISKHLGTLWRQLSAEEKNPFVKRAEELREQHKKQYPDYKYQPRRKQAAKAAAAAAAAATAAATAAAALDKRQHHQHHHSNHGSPCAGSGNELEQQQQQQQYGSVARMTSPARGHGGGRRDRTTANGGSRRRPAPYTSMEVTTTSATPTTIWTVEYGHTPLVGGIVYEEPPGDHQRSPLAKTEPDHPAAYHPSVAAPTGTPQHCQWVVPLADSPGDPSPDVANGSTTTTTTIKHPDQATGCWDLLSPVTVSLASVADVMDVGSPPQHSNGSGTLLHELEHRSVHTGPCSRWDYGRLYDGLVGEEVLLLQLHGGSSTGPQQSSYGPPGSSFTTLLQAVGRPAANGSGGGNEVVSCYLHGGSTGTPSTDSSSPDLMQTLRYSPPYEQTPQPYSSTPTVPQYGIVPSAPVTTTTTVPVTPSNYLPMQPVPMMPMSGHFPPAVTASGAASRNDYQPMNAPL
ncbi:putative transcription factor SOX-15 [Anopheles darlingi]|uniref:putative transcription factor SOX-15 n=1 Tax=Anopheles darlingi TaxID=43151 RepID=UPI0021000351|nr:putative transcription factor SOX-15 [Anopheles darlingi]